MAAHNLHLTEKILLVGDSGVGKSSLLLRYCNNDVPLSQFKLQPTVGLDFKRKTLMVPLPNGQDALVTLQIWDTAGLERFRAVTTSYYHGAMGVVIVYDVCNDVSFTNVG
jgi:small GTP-binding protein